MEENAVKKGYLYMYQQQTFGKKWQKFWSILYGGSGCASACLEFQECSLPPSTGKARKRESSSRRLIHLKDCVYVAETSKDSGCPKETSPFLLETTGKCYLLAAERAEAEDWILELCEHAFRKKSKLETCGMAGAAPMSLLMAENPLYSPTCTGEKQHFPVTVRATPASERIRLWGKFLLSAQTEALELCDLQRGSMLFTWPYSFLRRFGHSEVVFSFEAGRRCSSGEGSFEFVTPHGKEIMQLVEKAIDAQKGSRMSDHEGWGQSDRTTSSATLRARATNLPGSDEGTQGTTSTALDKGPLPSRATGTPTFLSLESIWQGKLRRDSPVPPAGSSTLPTSAKRSPPRQPPASCFGRDPQVGPRVLEGPGKMVAEGSECVEPLDAASVSLVNCGAGQPSRDPERVSSPPALDVGIQGEGLPSAWLELAHVYDDPEALAHLVYDEPQEIKGEAWKQRTAAEDPVGHKYPYSPCLGDYSVPKMVAASPVQQPRKGRKGLGQALCEHQLLRLKIAKDTA